MKTFLLVVGTICQNEPIQKVTSEFINPTVVAALIAALVALSSVYLSYRTLSIQRLQSERNEIYKKLNDFYGPMRLLLRNSDELYKLFSKKIKRKIQNPIEFRTLPYILEGNIMDKTEKALFTRIIEIGKTMEEIIEKNAGLIDDDDLNNEMIELSTHIRIIRMAYRGKLGKGEDIKKLFEGKTFPDKITAKVDGRFYKFKDRLNELNKVTKGKA
jgi:hypothetical protein